MEDENVYAGTQSKMAEVARTMMFFMQSPLVVSLPASQQPGYVAFSYCTITDR
jgi:hypothetical protein